MSAITALSFRVMTFAKRLRHNQSGLALVEFAYSLPLVMLLTLSGTELANYATVKMRVSQVALHVADNGARIGTGTLLSAKQISETQINDLLTGAGYQGGELNLYANGRVILSSVEPNDNSATPSVYKVAWQRCRGAKNYSPQFGTTGVVSNNGMGPSGRRVIPPPNGAVMLVEVSYTYQPLFTSSLVPNINIVELAAMTVRDNRDRTQIYNTENATVSSCS